MSQIVKKFIGNDQVDGTKIKLLNNQALRARNAANSADVDILKLNASDVAVISAALSITGSVSASNLSGSNTGDISLGAVGASPSANGASLSGQVLTLQPFDATNPGVVTASGGGTSNFLRADGTWAAPASSGANVTLSNLTSPTAINQDLIFNKATPIVKSADQTGATPSEPLAIMSGASDSAASGSVEISTSGPTTVGDSGAISILTGQSADGNSGQIAIQTGDASVSGSNSGNLSLVTGAGATGTSISGYIVLQTGSVDAGNAPGNINLTTGNNGTISGDIGITAEHIDLVAFTSTRIANAAGTARPLVFLDNTATTSVGLKAPASGADNTVYVLPASDGSNGQLLQTNGSGVLSFTSPAAAPINNKELITLSGTDITNQYIDLAHVAKTNSIDFVVKGGGIMIEGASYDYSVSYTGGAGGNTRITFLNDLATGGAAALIAGDIVVAKYQY